MYQDIKAKYTHYFEDHEATIVSEDDNILALDFRNKNGSIEYYIGYIFDRRHGLVAIHGDVGYAIACWHNPLEPERIRDFSKDVSYFLEKVETDNDKYTYCYDDIKSDLCDLVESRRDEVDNVDELLDEILLDADFYPEQVYFGDNARNILEDELGFNYESYGNLGRRINPRVYLWIVGLDLAMEQLNR